MAWEARGSRAYFYRSLRQGSKVRKVYLGAGDVAKQAAERAAGAKAKRTADQAALANFQSKLAGVDQLVASTTEGVDLLTEATLLAIGYHQHRGTWRSYREKVD